MRCVCCHRSLGPLTLLSSMGYPTCPSCNQTYVADIPWIWPALLFLSIPSLDLSMGSLCWVLTLTFFGITTQKFHPIDARRRLGPWLTSFRARPPAETAPGSFEDTPREGA